MDTEVKVMSATITTMGIIKTQIKRELWENKTGFIKAPLVVTSLLLILVFAVTTYSLITHSGESRKFDVTHFECSENNCSFNNSGAAIDSNSSNKFKHSGVLSSVTSDPSVFKDMILSIMYGNCFLLSGVLFIVLLGYVLRCLFDDRKNNEILFWRSMPVSETTNVLVKLVMQILVAPLILLVSNVAVIFAVFLVGAIVLFVCGVPISHLIAPLLDVDIYLIPLQIFFENVFGFLMLLPVIGYLLFTSAIAKKSPFFIAAIIPGVLLISDLILKKLAGINLGFIDAFGPYGRALFRVKETYILKQALILDMSMLWPFILCVLVGSLWVAAAIWLRNNRYEI